MLPCVSECVSAWVRECWVSAWVSECVSEWVSAWVSEWVNEWVSEWVSECVHEWVSEWVIEWVSECCRVAYSSGFVEWYLTNIFLRLIDMFETKDFVWFSAMPLFLCRALLSGVGRTFIYEKPCPKLKAWLRASPLRKIIHCHATNLVGFRTFREKITGLCIPQDLWKHIFQSSSSIW